MGLASSPRDYPKLILALDYAKSQEAASGHGGLEWTLFHAIRIRGGAEIRNTNSIGNQLLTNFGLGAHAANTHFDLAVSDLLSSGIGRSLRIGLAWEFDKVIQFFGRVPGGTVAVMPFAASGSATPEDADRATDAFNAAIIGKHLRVVERNPFAVEQAMQELNLQQSGLTNQRDTAELGKWLNAEYLFTGTIFRGIDGYTTNVILIRTETGEEVAAALSHSREHDAAAKELSQDLATKFQDMAGQQR